MPSVLQTQRALGLFFSYSHKDQDLRDRLETHLTILKRQGLISAWHDRQIRAGKEWGGEISQHLESAQIILLLVSADFLASDYCYDIEMKLALERHDARKARVIPIILKPVDWQGAPFSKLQALPKNGKPVTSWPDIEEAFFDIAKGIRSITQELTRHEEQAASPMIRTDVVTETDKTSWCIVFSATIDDIDKPKAEAIVEHLRKLSGDVELTLKKIAAGTVKIYIDGNLKGFLKIKSLFENKDLTIIHGFKLLDVRLDKPDKAVPALIKALRDDNNLIRRDAASALGNIGFVAETAVPALIKALRDQNEGVRWHAAIALGKIGLAAVPALIEALKDENRVVRRWAAYALGIIGPAADAAVPALMEAIRDQDKHVRKGAAYALGNIGTAAKAVVLVLIKALQDDEVGVRNQAASALGKIGTPEAMRAIEGYKNYHGQEEAAKKAKKKSIK